MGTFAVLSMIIALVLLLVSFDECLATRKLLLVIVEGFPGSIYHRFGRFDAFQTIEKDGVWTDLLYPVFPSYSLPNQVSLLTGQLPRKHGILGQFMHDPITNRSFLGGTQPSDFDAYWWQNVELFWSSALHAGRTVAVLRSALCGVPIGPIPTVCTEPRSDADGFAHGGLEKVLEATKGHDVTVVFHGAIERQLRRRGVRHVFSEDNNTIAQFATNINILLTHVRTEMTDVNLVIVSDHGMMDVPMKNRRYLDDYLDLDLIQTTVGYGAVKQIVPRAGTADQIFRTLRNERPIPNVKIYYSDKLRSDLPNWYEYEQISSSSTRLSELVLIANPGYAILTHNSLKQIPSTSDAELSLGMSGYNNQFPDMLGILLAYGPSLKRGERIGARSLLDVYRLLCRLTNIDGKTDIDADERRIADILDSAAFTSVARGKSWNGYYSFLLTLLSVLWCWCGIVDDWFVITVPNS